MTIIDYTATHGYRPNDHYPCDCCGAITPMPLMYDVTIEDEDEVDGWGYLTICGECLADNKERG